MVRGKAGMVSNEDRVHMTQTYDDEMKKRARHAKGLRERNPRSLAWAVKVGLKHWHAVGFGCGSDCLKGAGEQEDPDRLNYVFVRGDSRTFHGTRVDPERTKRKEQIRKVAATRAQTDARLRREGLIP